MSLLTEFRSFVLRGNVVDLAVGVVIGAAFTGVVTAFTKDFLTPLIGIPGKVEKFENLYFKIGDSQFQYGDFINTLVTFLLTALVVFFLVVKPVNYLMARYKTETPVEPTTKECPFCLSKIPILATRCAFCTSELEPAAPAA